MKPLFHLPLSATIIVSNREIDIDIHPRCRWCYRLICHVYVAGIVVQINRHSVYGVGHVRVLPNLRVVVVDGAGLTDTLCEDELEESIPQERRKSSFHNAPSGDDDWCVPTDDPTWIAHIEESCNAHEAEIDAAIALVLSENLARAGALALLLFASELEGKCRGCWPNELFDDDGKRRS